VGLPFFQGANIKGKQPCWECAGTGQSPRGYGDSSPCGTCGETGIIKISRIELIIDCIKRNKDFNMVEIHGIIGYKPNLLQGKHV
jgi:hypothetical protein